MLRSFVNNACGPLLDCGMSFTTGRNYLARTPAFSMFYQGYKLYSDLILHLQQLLTFEPKQGKIALEWYSDELLDIRTSSNNPVENCVQQYIFLRESARSNWVPQRLQEAFVESLSERIVAVEKPPSGGTSAGTDGKARCKTCGTTICPASGFTGCVTGEKNKSKARAKIKEMVQQGCFKGVVESDVGTEAEGDEDGQE